MCLEEILMKTILMLMVALVATLANSQTHTFKFILSSGPGSGSDTTLEIYSVCLKQQNVLALKEFKQGAEGLVAIKYLNQQTDTDKVTNILVGNFGMSAFSKFPNINMLEDVHPIAYLNQVSMVFIAKHGGVSSIEDVIKLSTYRPINVGISTTSGTFLSETLFNALHIPYQLVPYKNNTGAITDLLNGNLDIAVDTFIGAKQLVDADKLQIISSTLNKKIALQYNHNSIEKYNSKIQNIPLGIILSVNPTLPKEKKIELAKIVNRCNKDAEVIEKLEKIGSSPVYLTTDEIRNIIKLTINK
jgi:tripartite-type tricarboxylate transporter receptor subunit TctC